PQKNSSTGANEQNDLRPEITYPPSTGFAGVDELRTLSPVAASDRLPPTTTPELTIRKMGSAWRSPRYQPSAAAPTPNKCMFVARAVDAHAPAMIRWHSTKVARSAPPPPSSVGTTDVR